MMTASTIGETTFTTPTDRMIEMTRLFDAPRELVFDVCTNPEHLPHWFGPRGWSLPVCEIDLRPGGAWRYVLRGPDGEEMGMSGVYKEISPPDRIVSTESFDDYPGESLNTLTLRDEDGKTRYTVTVLYASKETRDAVLASGMSEGAAQTFERLAERLALLQAGTMPA
jgi:uncharacterized protein YndB with AHSA1/START domain